MRIVEIKVSSPKDGFSDAIVVKCRKPETFADQIELAKNETVASEIMGQRYVVRVQDDILRPALVDGASAEELQTLTDNADPDQFRLRGSVSRPRGPRVIKVKKQKTYSAEDFVRIVAKLGKTISFTD